MRVALNGYDKPTPPGVKRVADAVLASTTMLGPVLLTVNPALGVATMVVGSVAKLISNLFVDDKPKCSSGK